MVLFSHEMGIIWVFLCIIFFAFLRFFLLFPPAMYMNMKGIQITKSAVPTEIAPLHVCMCETVRSSFHHSGVVGTTGNAHFSVS